MYKTLTLRNIKNRRGGKAKEQNENLLVPLPTAASREQLFMASARGWRGSELSVLRGMQVSEVCKYLGRLSS